MLRPPRRTGCTKDTARCDFVNWGPGTMRPPCCTAHLTELTVRVHELLARHGIRHWVDYGTLLGAVRQQAFIPWDDDVDFGVHDEDVPRILALEPELSAAGHVVDATTDPLVIRIHYSEINRQHLDLLWWSDHDGMLETQYAFASPGLSSRESFPRRYLERMEAVDLYGARYPAPSPVHDFLADHRFGPDYMIPTRFARSTWLYPPLEADEMTPAVKGLLAALAEAEHRLAELDYRSRLSRTRAWQAWRNAGRPLAPSTRHLDRATSAVPPTERSEKVEQLAYAVASFETAIEELRHRGPAGSARRTYRRGVRGGQAISAKLTANQRPAFGQPRGARPR